MHSRLSILRGQRRAARHAGPPALALACTIGGLAAPAAGAAPSDSPIVAVSGSSVIVTRQPAGSATITASRRDPLTGRPVVIGQFTGPVNGLGPFSVNTTPPDVGGGDCWQKGALTSALTPDLLPGDAVTVTGAPDVAGGVQPPAMRVIVPPDAKPSEGPIPACASVAPFARNVISDAPQQVTEGPITVSGRAQPLATGVSLTAADAASATPSASATPADDGTWSATIPAAAVAALADGPLLVTPVFTVPDVSTGAPSHIAGAPVIVQKASAPAAPAPGGADSSAPLAGAGGAELGGTSGGPGRPAPKPSPATGPSRVSGLRLPARLSAGTARARGISASLIAPAGASTVQLELLHGGKALYTTAVPARPGARATVRLSSGNLRRLLRPGRYVLRVRAGSSLKHLGPPLLRGLVVR